MSEWVSPDPVDWKERYNRQHVKAQMADRAKEKAERQVRDLTRDRDHWKERAVAAEAALKSAGLR